MNKWLIAMTCLMAGSAFAQTPAQTPTNGQAPSQMSAEAAFKQRDANKDGFLSKTEITGSRVADRFDQLDTNKDGKLSLAEYQAGRNAMRGNGPQAGGAAQGGPPGGTQGGAPGQGGGMRSAEDMFKERDTNKDGYLSKSELSNSRMADRFDQIDTNKDGKLSLDELKAARQNMGAGGPQNRQKSGT